MKTDAPRIARAIGGGARALALLALAVVARWPLSIAPTAWPLDPNTPLHALVAANLFEHGALSPVLALGWPDGEPVRVVGLPLILLMQPLLAWLAPATALNVAAVALIWLQGLALDLLGGHLGWRWQGRLAAGAAAIACPAVSHLSGNGQFENLAAPALALAVAAGGARPLVCGLAGAAALALAGFSSPYQAVPAGALLVLCALRAGWRQLGAALLASALVGGAVTAYYGQAIAQARGEAALISPPSSSGDGDREGLTASAGLMDLVTPRALYFNAPVDFPAPGRRLAALNDRPGEAPAGSRWAYAPTPQASYLGLALIGLGLAGLLAARRERWVAPVAAAGVACLVLALGPRLSFWSGSPGSLPLPWALAGALPALEGLSATYRFLAGVSFALAVGVGALFSRLPAPAVAAAVALLAADGWLRAPAPWPLPGAHPRLELPLADAPVAIWPGAGRVPGQVIEGLALALGQPVAVYRGDGPVEDWLERGREAGVETLIRLEDLAPGAIEEPALQDLNGARCYAGLCPHPLK